MFTARTRTSRFGEGKERVRFCVPGPFYCFARLLVAPFTACGPHAGPHRAAQSFLAASQQFIKQVQPTKNHPLPKLLYTRFYLLTAGNGVLTAEAKEDDLGHNRHPLSPLFYKGHELISEVLAVDQKLRAEQDVPEGRSTL